VTDIFKMLDNIKVWQLFFGVGVALIVLGLTGEVRDVTLIEGEEIHATVIGCIFVALSVLMRMTPDPLKARRVEVSAAQLEFASKFVDWEPYDDATHDLLYSDHLLESDEKSIKISGLRIELALLQGLLEVKTENGQRKIRYIKPKDKSY
jgi:hypothetical protein